METAGLYDLLKQKGSYTVFAPTDDAFVDLSKEDMALLKSEYPTAVSTYPLIFWKTQQCCQGILI